MSGEITSDPQVMAEIADEFWKGVWSKRDKAPSATKDYLKGYKKILGADVRKLPTLVDNLSFIDIINSTNNSCAGPDGVPFAVYRAAPHVYSTIAAGLFLALSEGVQIPKVFTDGLLFLLPKTCLLFPDDTRPLSVTNAFNRIIASGVVSSITPSLQAFLEPNQKGFIPGRSGDDHIRDLNRKFYNAVKDKDKNSNLYVLFVDTKKAFDSIDHDYLLFLLKQIDFPLCLCILVLSLPVFHTHSPPLTIFPA